VTLHWAHVTAGYALVVGGFALLALNALRRHASARRRLAELDPRASRVSAPGQVRLSARGGESV